MFSFQIVQIDLIEWFQTRLGRDPLVIVSSTRWIDINLIIEFIIPDYLVIMTCPTPVFYCFPILYHEYKVM